MESIPLDDAKTYAMLAEGDSTGVFQFESEGMRDALRKVKPTEFADIVALGALYRPGAMAYIPAYAKGKKSVAAADIDEAARDLKLADSSTEMRDTSQTKVASASEAKTAPKQNARSPRVPPGERGEEFTEGWKDYRSEVDSPFFVEVGWHKPQPPPRRSGMRGLLLLCLVAAIALFVATQGEPALGPMMRGYLAKLSDLAHSPAPEQQPLPPPDTASENDHNTVSQVAPVPSDLQPVAPDPESAAPSMPQAPSGCRGRWTMRG